LIDKTNNPLSPSFRKGGIFGSFEGEGADGAGRVPAKGNSKATGKAWGNKCS
jgi:hypothetical protein